MSLGHIVRLSAFLTRAFNTSMEVEVEVHSEDPRTSERLKTCSAFFTMVCLGLNGRPRPVPPLALRTDDERRRAEEALQRRGPRLERRPRAAT